MEYTKNLMLSKPSYDDDVDVQILNNNMDILDAKVGDLPYLPLTGGMMTGDIWLNHDVGFKYGGKSALNFNKIKDIETLNAKADVFKFNDVFTIDSEAIKYNNDKVLLDKETSIGEFEGYTKSSNGVIMQWGYVETGDNDAMVKHVTFKHPMPNAKYVTFLTRSNVELTTPPILDQHFYTGSFNHTTTGLDIQCDEKEQGRMVFWLVIGG